MGLAYIKVNIQNTHINTCLVSKSNHHVFTPGCEYGINKLVFFTNNKYQTIASAENDIFTMAGLRSRVVLITGATSCIGRSTALSFAEIGAKLALVGMKTNDTDTKEASYESQRLQKISEECKHVGAADIHIGQYDVTNQDGCRVALEEATERFRGNYDFKNFKNSKKNIP